MTQLGKISGQNKPSRRQSSLKRRRGPGNDLDEFEKRTKVQSYHPYHHYHHPPPPSHEFHHHHHDHINEYEHTESHARKHNHTQAHLENFLHVHNHKHRHKEKFKDFFNQFYEKVNKLYARKHIILQFLNSFPQHDHYHDHEKTAILEHQHQQDHKNIHQHINIEPQQYWQRNPALVPALVSNFCENNPLLVKIIINNSSY